MFKQMLVLVMLSTVSACATTPQTAKQECVSQTEESTGSRVEANKVCAPTD